MDGFVLRRKGFFEPKERFKLSHIYGRSWPDDDIWCGKTGYIDGPSLRGKASTKRLEADRGSHQARPP